MTRSSIFEKTGRIDIGRWFFNCSSASDLNKGITLAIFILLGNIPAFREMLQI